MYIIDQDIPKIEERKPEKAPEVWPLKQPEESKQEELDLKVQQMMDQF